MQATIDDTLTEKPVPPVLLVLYRDRRRLARNVRMFRTGERITTNIILIAAAMGMLYKWPDSAKEDGGVVLTAIAIFGLFVLVTLAANVLLTEARKIAFLRLRSVQDAIEQWERTLL